MVEADLMILITGIKVEVEIENEIDHHSKEIISLTPEDLQDSLISLLTKEVDKSTLDPATQLETQEETTTVTGLLEIINPVEATEITEDLMIEVLTIDLKDLMTTIPEVMGIEEILIEAPDYLLSITHQEEKTQDILQEMMMIEATDTLLEPKIIPDLALEETEVDMKIEMASEEEETEVIEVVLEEEEDFVEEEVEVE